MEVVALRVAATGDSVEVKFTAAKMSSRKLAGPHVETLADATMVVAAGWTARALEIGGWLVERE